MLDRIGQITLTVSDIDSSLEFYRDKLGMKVETERLMNWETTEILFGLKSAQVRVAQLKGCRDCGSPDIKLLQFEKEYTLKDQILGNKVSISGIVFEVEDVDSTYEELKSKGVEFVSEPQIFEAVRPGAGNYKSVYFRDPDGILLELQPLSGNPKTADEMDIKTDVGPSEYAATDV